MKLTWNAALEETEMVLFETVHKLLKTTGIDAQDVSRSLLQLICAPAKLLACKAVFAPVSMLQ